MRLARVMIVDDDALFRDALSSLLAAADIEVVGLADNGLQVVERASAARPHLILMDVRMPKMSGIEAAQIVKASQPGIKIVMLSAVDDGRTLSRAIRFGADGFISKDTAGEELVNEVRIALRGETVLSSRLAARVIAIKRTVESGDGDVQARLTRRELDVIAGVVAGRTNLEIADVLYLSPSTVKFHLSNVLSKLYLRNRVEAAAYAIEHGLVDPPNALVKVAPVGFRPPREQSETVASPHSFPRKTTG